MDAKITDLLARAEHRVDVCIAFALLWIAAPNGALNVNTHTVLRRHIEALPGGSEHSDELLAIIDANDLDSFLVACRILQRELREEEKSFFLELAIEAAVSKNHLATSANHILRLYGDLLDIKLEQLSALYREKIGNDLPEPGDPGSVLWWEVREQRSFHNAGYQLSPGRRFTRAEAYAVLGLDAEAPRAEIKKAYRRLVQNYHPDRHVSLGPDAKEAAELNFLRVQQAYEVLSQ